MKDKSCPLCSRAEAELQEASNELDLERWDCPWCGDFILKGRFIDQGILKQSSPHLLSGLAFERSLRGKSPLIIGPDNLDSLLSEAPETALEKADRLLLNLAIKSSEPGTWTSLTTKGHKSMAFVSAVDSFVGLLENLESEGLIETQGERRHDLNDMGFRLTLDGWRKVRELRQEGESDNGFAAMPFGERFDALWETAIKQSISEAGWRPVRADEEHHNERIDDWILNQIKDARFVVVDTTDSNPGACFEAGYALALGRPVIWTVQETAMEEGLHFDIRQYNHLTWTSGDEDGLVNDLTERIISTVGDGPRQ